MSSRTAMPPSSSTASACLPPSRPAPPVMTATRPVRSKACATVAGAADGTPPIARAAALSIGARLSAIDHEHRSGHEARPLRSQEYNDVSDLVRAPESLQGHLSAHVVIDGACSCGSLRLPAAARKQHVAGSDRVDAHA